ncbi:MAG TPA: dTDP-4-dehydrorhamnose reductase [Terracidiphilus sp.]
MTDGKRILIIGSLGQLGKELQRSFAGTGEITAYDRDEVDIANAASLRAMLDDVAPDIILNAAAYTAVDRAETEREIADAINASAPGILAEEARRRDALLVHYSTDYIFNGSKTSPWVETDAPQPLNHYGASKLAGEEAVAQAGGKYLIFRTSWVYGPHGGNFLLTMLRLGREREQLSIVDDQTGSPTTSMALADATRTIVDGVREGKFGDESEWAGLYHMTCGGVTTWFGFAQELFARAERVFGQRSPVVTPISSDAWPSPAPRPRYSVLSNEKLRERFGVVLPDWKTELDRTFDRLVETQ